MKVKEELTRIKKLLLQGELGEAIQLVDSLEKGEMTSDERLTCKLLKSKLLVKQGQFKEATKIAEQALKESQLAGKSLQEIDVFLVFSEISWRTGNVDEGLAFIERAEKALVSITGIHPEEIAERKGELLHHKGIIYRRKGELDRPLKLLQQSLECRKTLKTKHGMAETLNSLGVIFYYMGDLNRALDHYRQSLEIKEELGNKQQIAITLNNFGDVYQAKGELDKALECLLQCNILLEETTGNKEHLAASFHNIGNVYRNKGDLDLALEYLEKGLVLGKETGTKLFIAESLYYLIQLAVDRNDLDLARSYLQHLQEISEQMDNKVINQYHQVAQALLLKTSNRLRDKLKSSELLENVIKGEIVDHGVTVTAMLHSCELLLFELKTSGEEEVLVEIKLLANKLLKIAKLQASHSLLAETYLLLSRLALIELNLTRAQQLIVQARLIAEERGLEKLAITISHEEDLLLSQISNWELVIDQRPSLKEVTRLTQITDLIERMIHKKVYMNDDEIIEYVTMAKKLLDAWNRAKKQRIS